MAVAQFDESGMLREFQEHHPTRSFSIDSFSHVVGVTPQIAAVIWNRYFCLTNFTCCHFMWTLSFLTVYGMNDIVMAALWGVSVNTYTANVWVIIEHLYNNVSEVCL